MFFFLFNGSLSFWIFLKERFNSHSLISDIIANNQFPSFGPYGDGVVSAFWNLNIYTNQRHLALSFGLSLLAILIILNPVLKNKKENFKKAILVGCIMGLLFLLNMAVFLMTAILLIVLFFLFSKIKKSIMSVLFFAFMFSFPQYLYFQSGFSTFKVFFNPGYLTSVNLTFFNFIHYWFFNLGLHFILIPIAYLISPKRNKKILFTFLSLFIIGNLFQFSKEMAANHKFFNYFLIVGVMFSAYAITEMWEKIKIFRPFLPLLFFILILSGIIDFFPIYNDSKIVLADYPKREEIKWIMKNTSKDSIFLNSDYLYNPASLAGRKIFIGWPYFAWSQGYDTLSRDLLRKDILENGTLLKICRAPITINYAILSRYEAGDININRDFFNNNFEKTFQNKQWEIYKVINTCSR
ncbi:hypothetical protein KKG52_03450 [Patescibacteria group bacterium]|nr:hypothetical protein [Patescibacteria group bacterium]